jgi:hypothetical protein
MDISFEVSVTPVSLQPHTMSESTAAAAGSRGKRSSATCCGRALSATTGHSPKRVWFRGAACAVRQERLETVAFPVLYLIPVAVALGPGFAA